MLRKPGFAVFVTTFYLILYYILFNFQAPTSVIATMFIFAPFLVAWMAYTILRYGEFKGKELEENEEWGYSDKDKQSLNTF